MAKLSKLQQLNQNSKTVTNILEVNDFYRKYSIYFSEDENINGVLAFEFRISLLESCTVAHCIKLCLPKLQQKFPDFSFPTHISSYSLHFAKKNGMPKSDLPGKFK